MNTAMRRAALSAGSVLVLVGMSAGAASAVAGPAVLSWQPAAHPFGAVPLREHRDLTLTLSNTGGRASSGLTVEVTGSSAYAVTADECSGHTLGPRKSCTVTVRFAPTVNGPANATVTVVGKHRVAPVTATLTGRGGGFGTGAPVHLYWSNFHVDSSASINKSPLTVNPLTVTPVVTSPPGLSSYLAVDESNAYWSDTSEIVDNKVNGKIRVAPLSGGPVTTLVENQIAPQGVAVAGGYLYWADAGDGSIKRVPVGGGPITPLVSGQSAVFNVAVDSNNLYWTTETATPTGGTIQYAPLTPTGVGPSVPLMEGLDSPGGLAVDDGQVYWTDAVPGTNPPLGTVNAVSVAERTVTVITSQESSPGSISASDGTAFWITGDPWIRSAPTANSATPTTLYSPIFDTPVALAIGP